MKKKLLPGIIALTLLIQVALAPGVLAHGVLKSLTKDTENSQMVIVYDETDLTLWNYTTFRFLLKDKDQNNLEIESVWFKVSQGADVVFAGPISSSSSTPAIATVSFPKKGTYQVFARFQVGQGTQSEATFDIEVPNDAGKNNYILYIVSGTAIFLAGSLFTLFGISLEKKLRKKSDKKA